MNPKLLFWVPAALRMVLALLGVAVVWYLFGATYALGIAFVLMAMMVFVQLSYLFQLSNWLDNPQSASCPMAGAPGPAFSRACTACAATTRKTRAELTEWLARFRQAMHLLPDGVVIMDDVLFLEWCNPAAEKHLGLTHERDKGMRVTNLIRSPEFMDYIILPLRPAADDHLPQPQADRADHSIRKPPPDFSSRTM